MSEQETAALTESTETTQPTEGDPSEPQTIEEAQQDTESTGDDTAVESPQKSKGVQKRIDELVKQREEERRRADRLEKMLERQLAGQQPQAQPKEEPAPEPTPEQFETYEQYVRASAKYEAEKAAARIAEERFQKETERRRTEEANRSTQDKIRIAKEKYSDFEEVALDPTLPITPSMAEAIMDSEFSADLAYHLGKNRSDAEKIARMSPIAAARALGKLEAEFERKATAAPALIEPKRVSKAPEPVKPLATSADAPNKDPDKMSTEEWLRWRNTQLGRK